MATNKVIYGNDTLIDLTQDTVTPDKVLSGYIFHDKAGVQQTGTSPGITPSGTKTITSNGTYDVTNYASVLAQVAGFPELTQINYNVVVQNASYTFTQNYDHIIVIWWARTSAATAGIDITNFQYPTGSTVKRLFTIKDANNRYIMVAHDLTNVAQNTSMSYTATGWQALAVFSYD